MHTGHAAAVIGPGIGKGVADDALACAARDDLRRMHGVCIDLFFYADIEIFGVLAEGDDVDILGMGVTMAGLLRAGRTLAYRSYFFLSMTLMERNPDPTGVVIGDLSSTLGALEGGECLFADQLPALFIQGQADLVDLIGKAALWQPSGS